jgi:antitoxin component of MazEF toxin-antitoxin module
VSLSLTIPRDLAVELGWKDNQKVVVKKRGQGILIEDWKDSSENQN